MGDSYSWLLKDISLLKTYKGIFITTRNGMFFALLFMGIGEQIQKTEFPFSKVMHGALLAVSYIALTIEISFVRHRAAENADLSMYFMLPVCIALLIGLLYRMQSADKDTKVLRQISSAVYLMQYGIIFVLTFAINRIPMLK